jgi:phosphatidylglycerophosphate synthase
VSEIRRAIVLAGLPGADALVGGLPLAARAALALRGAGVADVAVLAPGRPGWVAASVGRRDRAVARLEGPGDVPRFLAGTGHGPVLLVAGDTLLDEGGARALAAAAPGPVAGSDGGRPVALVCPAGDVPGRLEQLARRGWPATAGPAPRRGRGAAGPGLALALEGRSRSALERHLLDALARRTEAGDGYLAALIDRRLSRPVTRLLLRTSLTPSQVTLLSIAAGLLGAAGLASTSYGRRLAGVLLLVLSTVFDCVDGELARVRLEQSVGGARLDIAGDYAVHLAVFVGLATGLLRDGLPPRGAWAALGLVTGVVAAMAVMHVLFVRPALRGGGDVHWRGEGHRAPRDRFLATVAEKLASRDYTYVLLVLALAGHLEWFLYAAAAGSWAFTAAILACRALAVSAGRREPAAS